MEDVPLNDFNQPPVAKDETSLQQEMEQLARYKTQIGTTIELMHMYFSTLQGWELIDSNRVDVVLYEKHLANDNSFLLKAKAVVSGRASRYFHVIRDHEEYTRMPWDKENIASCKEYETYKAEEGDIVVVESVWKTRHPRLFNNRRVFGILSTVYNSEQETHSLYFCSSTHLRFGAAAAAAAQQVEAKAMLGIVLRKIDKQTTEITMVLRIDPNVSTLSVMSIMFANEYKEEMRKRVHLYTRVVQEWDKFYGPSKDPKKVENRR